MHSWHQKLLAVTCRVPAAYLPRTSRVPAKFTYEHAGICSTSSVPSGPQPSNLWWVACDYCQGLLPKPTTCQQILTSSKNVQSGPQPIPNVSHLDLRDKSHACFSCLTPAPKCTPQKESRHMHMCVAPCTFTKISYQNPCGHRNNGDV